MTDHPKYPDAPGFKVRGPSEQAALAIADTAKTLRDQVRDVIAAAPRGLTADEVAEKLNRSILSVRPPVAELHRKGDIRPSDGRGRNESGTSASLWVMSPLPQTREGEGDEQRR
jgi:hypothetical protein